MKKIIAMDLDGTLLDINGQVPDTTKKYLNKLKKEGHIIIIATGRIIPAAFQVADNAVFANYVIAESGTTIYDVDNKKTIEENHIELSTCKEIYKLSKNIYQKLVICTKEHMYFYIKGEQKLFRNYITASKQYDNLLDNNEIKVTHLSVHMKENYQVEKFFEKYKDKFEEIEMNIMQDSFKNTKWIEIHKKNINKFNGIKKITQKYNIPISDVISFGDGLNDIEMLQNSGIGIAMENALPEVKNVASEIALSHNDYGIEKWLIKYFKEQTINIS